MSDILCGVFSTLDSFLVFFLIMINSNHSNNYKDFLRVFFFLNIIENRASSTTVPISNVLRSAQRTVTPSDVYNKVNLLSRLIIYMNIYIHRIYLNKYTGCLVNFTIFGETHQKVLIYFIHINKYIMVLYRYDAPIENITTEISNL